MKIEKLCQFLFLLIGGYCCMSTSVKKMGTTATEKSFENGMAA
jgi:hypothetical protein